MNILEFEGAHYYTPTL